MKCPKCQSTSILDDFDSKTCVICGTRQWKEFTIRAPRADEMPKPGENVGHRIKTLKGVKYV